MALATLNPLVRSLYSKTFDFQVFYFQGVDILLSENQKNLENQNFTLIEPAG
jgi:hypothetical protein